jgi:glycosyltransferase involved in cell wall biosynthesis
MKLLIHSTAFYPHVGGYETSVMLFAQHFAARGYDLTIITYTPDPNYTVFPFKVIRNPGLKVFFQELRRCDVFVHESVSLKAIWQLFFVPKPLVIVHHNFWEVFLKIFVARFAVNICVSNSIAEKLPEGKLKTVIHNPYDEGLFRLLNEKRDIELVYLGRLVNEKGVSVLLKALNLLKNQNLFPRLTIIGDGHIKEVLQEEAKTLGLEKQVTWLGVKRGEDLVKHLNQHQIMVVPSTYEEPFGIVALEGMACGCVPIVSERGGLKEAIGECGITFPNGDAEKLAEILSDLLADKARLEIFREKAKNHLLKHTRKAVGEQYEAIFENLPNYRKKQPDD